MSKLFAPLLLGSLRLRTRLVMAPMTRAFCPEGVPTAAVAEYYASRARHQVGLVISEGAYVDHPASASYESCPKLFGERALDGWRAVVDSVRAAGGAIFPQLWHVGSHRRLGQAPDPKVPGYAPASYVNPQSGGNEPTHAMTERDIADVVASFARAGLTAQRLGFDGVEIQGAHGYLIDEFLWSVSNTRTDRYGGLLAARTRFAAEVIHAIRREVGPIFPIALRLSQHKLQDQNGQIVRDAREIEQLTAPLVDAGLSLFDIVARSVSQPAFTDSALTLGGWFRKLSGRPVIVNGSVGLDKPGQRDAGLAPLDAVDDLLARDEVDLIAVGRGLLADAEWGSKVREGRLDERHAYKAEMRASL
jgi:2,4-dienoyl-CoA reductase-like NADH-dependent reductase (Old Yellow Enzyme family)